MNKLGHEKVAKATRKSKLPCGVSKHLVARPISGATPRSNTHTQPLQNRSPKNRLAPPMGTTTTSHLYNTTILRGRLSNSLSLSLSSPTHACHFPESYRATHHNGDRGRKGEALEKSNIAFNKPFPLSRSLSFSGNIWQVQAHAPRES